MAKKHQHHPAHIKERTRGTSNEISFSVLDALKLSLDGNLENPEPRFPGMIALFSLPGRMKKPKGTPEREHGIHDATGNFVAVDSPEDRKSKTGGFGRKTPRVPRSTAALRHLSQGRKNKTEDSEQADSASVLPRAGRQQKISRHKVKNSARNTAEGGTGKGKTVRASSFSAPKSSATQGHAAKQKRVLTPEEELARRKTLRKARRWVAGIITAVLVLTACAVGGTYLYRQYQSYQDNVSKLKTAFSLINTADETILVLDEVVDDPLSQAKSSERAQIRAEEERLMRDLNEAMALANEVSLRCDDAEEKEVAIATVDAVNARLLLIEKGKAVLDASDTALEAQKKGEEAWAKLTSAESALRESANLIKDTTLENIAASKEKSEEAIELFEACVPLFEEAQACYPAVDYAPFFAYIEKAIETQRYAIASDDALTDRNKEEAEDQNDRYNQAADELAELGEKLPKSVSSLVSEVFAEQTAETVAQYQQARSQAGTSDSFIRDYLGLSTE